MIYCSCIHGLWPRVGSIRRCHLCADAAACTHTLLLAWTLLLLGVWPCGFHTRQGLCLRSCHSQCPACIPQRGELTRLETRPPRVAWACCHVSRFRPHLLLPLLAPAHECACMHAPCPCPHCLWLWPLFTHACTRLVSTPARFHRPTHPRQRA